MWQDSPKMIFSVSENVYFKTFAQQIKISSGEKWMQFPHSEDIFLQKVQEMLAPLSKLNIQ